MDPPRPASHPSSRGANGVLKPVRRAGLRALLLPGLRRLYRPFLRNAATIFLLHRFADPELGHPGHDPAHLHECLSWLRRQDVPLVSLGELVQKGLAGDAVPHGAVCFTVDDAYCDFHSVGLPVFEEHGCPVTVFVPTGFVDGDCWLWWDQLEHIVRRTERSRLSPPFSGGTPLELDGDAERRRVARSLRLGLQRVPDARKDRALEQLSAEAEVPIPDDPPYEFRPMSWSQIRDAEARGARFAPHSVTHPVLSQTSGDRLEPEIAGSWSCLREQVEHPVPVFGYPLGADWAFGKREEQAVRDAGLMAAVSTRRRYMRTRVRAAPADYRWRLPRLGFPPDRTEFLQIVSGLLRFRHLVTKRPADALTRRDGP